MQTAPLLIIQAGTSPAEIRDQHGDVPSWFVNALDYPPEAVEVVRVFEGEPLPEPDARRAAVITGSWDMVTEKLPWSEATAGWIRRAVAINMPVFGVCYGHQLMAYALGGTVEYHAKGREVGCQPIELHPAAADDPILHKLPARFPAHLTHLQTVTRLPPGARVLASSAHDQHQIIRYGPNALSTQFHPEFTPGIAQSLIHMRSGILHSEGWDPAALCRALSDTHYAREILKSFILNAIDTQTTEQDIHQQGKKAASMN